LLIQGEKSLVHNPDKSRSCAPVSRLLLRWFADSASACRVPPARFRIAHIGDGSLVGLRSTLSPRPSAPVPGSVALAVGSSAHPPRLQSRATWLLGGPLAIGSSPAHPVARRSPLASAHSGLPCSSSYSFRRCPPALFPYSTIPSLSCPASCKKLARTQQELYMVFGRKQGGSLSSCRHGSELRFRRTFQERQTHAPLSCEIVGLLQPGDQLCIHVIDGVHANAMGEQRIEACSGFEPLRRGYILEDESKVDARRRRRLDHRKLFLAPQAHIALLRCQFNISAKHRDRRHQCIVERLQIGLLATIQLSDWITTGSLCSHENTCRLRLAHLESHAMR